MVRVDAARYLVPYLSSDAPVTMFVPIFKERGRYLNIVTSQKYLTFHYQIARPGKLKTDNKTNDISTRKKESVAEIKKKRKEKDAEKEKQN